MPTRNETASVKRHGADRLTPKGPEVVLIDATVLTMDRERRAMAQGFLWMKDGRIQDVGSMAEIDRVPREVPRRALAGHIVMPGLVNCHTHLGNGFMRGIYDEMPLEVWFAKGMWPVLDAMDAREGHDGAALALLELMRSGVTTTACGEICTPNAEVLDGVLTAVERAGVRAVVSRIAMDSANDTSQAQYIPPEYREIPARSAEEVRRAQRTYNSDRISVGSEALGVLRCTPEMIREMHGVAVDTGAHFSMHVASSQDERDESRRRFGHGSVSELERLGVLGPRTLIAHGIWLDDREIEHLAVRQTGLSHNPVANAYYGAGVARLPALLDKGVRVGMGVDGASTNNSQNVWETMKMAVLFQKQALEQAGFGSAQLALELMTCGGAAALHMEDEIGSLETGKRADVIVIDTARLSLTPLQTAVSSLVYSNDPHAVRDVYVDGELIVSNGEHRVLKEPEVIHGANRSLDSLLRKTGLDEYMAKRGRWQWL